MLFNWCPVGGILIECFFSCVFQFEFHFDCRIKRRRKKIWAFRHDEQMKDIRRWTENDEIEYRPWSNEDVHHRHHFENDFHLDFSFFNFHPVLDERFFINWSSTNFLFLFYFIFIYIARLIDENEEKKCEIKNEFRL